jgi:hypothetical protein
MAQPFAPRFRRPMTVLLCAQFLWSASGATEIPAIGANARWPQPALQVSQTEPNFQAPSATHCARPVQTHETPGVRNAQLERPRPTPAPTMGRLDAAPPEALRKAEPAAAAEKKAYGSSARELSAAMPPVAESVPAPIAVACGAHATYRRRRAQASPSPPRPDARPTSPSPPAWSTTTPTSTNT